MMLDGGNTMASTIKLPTIIFLSAAILAVAACGPTTPADTTPAGVPIEAAPVSGVEITNTSVSSQAGGRLDRMRQRGHLVCGTTKAVAGYGFLNADGENDGFEIDLCRAVAVAVFGDPKAVEFRIIGSAAERGPSLASGEIDILAWVNTWTTSRDATWGGNFVHTTLYDGQGFAVPAELGITSAYQLKGASVCVAQGTTTELNLEDFNRENQLDINVVTFETIEASITAYVAGQCDAYTTDRTFLKGEIIAAGGAEDEHIVLPETISEEPISLAVPHGDEQWFDIVKSVVGILIYAEAYDVNSGNVPAASTGNTKVDRLFGFEGSWGQDSIGLSPTVAQDVVRELGNYGEIYERHFGSGGLGVPRPSGSRNALWADAPCQNCPKGGQIYAPPFR